MAQWNLFMVFQLTRSAIMHGETPPNIVFQRSYHPMEPIYGVRPALIHHITPYILLLTPLDDAPGLFDGAPGLHGKPPV